MLLSPQMLAPRYKTPIATAAYSGPGDIVSGALWWVGLRGYTAALSDGTHAAVDLVDQAGGNALTGVKILSTGALDVASIATWVTANSVTTIKITKLYDQTGNGVHMTQATLSKMPTLTLSAFGSLPGVTFDGSAFTLVNLSPGISQAQPFTFSTVYNQNGNSTNTLLSVDAGVEFDGGNGANTVLINAGTSLSAAATNNSTHAIQCVVNNASSSLNVDGSQTTGTTGANGSSASHIYIGSYDSAAFFWPGKIGEIGEWAGAFSGGQITSMNSQQHSYWGF